MIAKQPVLIIDDDEAIQEFVKMALKNEGYAVATASDGAIALDTLQTIEPFLILLDMFMPNMDGPTFIEAFRRMPLPPVPIIMLTAANLHSDLPPGLAVDGILEKPFNLDDLLALVENFAPQ